MAKTSDTDAPVIAMRGAGYSSDHTVGAKGVIDAAAGLMLDHVTTRVTPCLYAASFQRHGDSEVFARAYSPTLRSWTESTFFSALDSERSVEERQAILNRF